MSNPKDTVCKDCVFAKYEDITQVDCKLHMLDVFREKGVEVLECFDEELEFFVLSNKRCPYKRTKEWAKDFDDPMEQVLEDVSLPFQAIIIANDNLEDLEKTIESLNEQTLPIKHITVIRKINNTLPPKSIVETVERIAECKWRIENLASEASDEEIVYNVVKIIKIPYYSVFHAGYLVEPDFFKKISDYVTLKQNKFFMIKPSLENSINGLVIPLIVHQYVYASKEPEQSFEDYLRQTCPDPKIKDIMTICQA